MKPISSLKLSFITSLPRSELYHEALNWMRSRSKENDDLWKTHHYYNIYSTKEDEEIKFGVFKKTVTHFHTELNPAVIHFKQLSFSQVEIILDIPKLVAPDILKNYIPQDIYDYAYEIIQAIFPVVPQEYLKTIYIEEFLNFKLWQQRNVKISVYIELALLVLLPFVWDSILAKVISIVFISAWLIDKYVFKTKPTMFYSEMKRELYPESV